MATSRLGHNQIPGGPEGGTSKILSNLAGPESPKGAPKKEGQRREGKDRREEGGGKNHATNRGPEDGDPTKPPWRKFFPSNVFMASARSFKPNHHGETVQQAWELNEACK